MNNISLDELIVFAEWCARVRESVENKNMLYEIKQEADKFLATAEALRELQSLRQQLKEKDEQLEKYRAVVESARGLALGEDWNKGTHAKKYRPQLIEALKIIEGIEKGNGAESGPQSI